MQEVVFDIEIFPNYALFGFKRLSDGKVWLIDTTTKLSSKQVKKIYKLLNKYSIVTFNGNKYDLVITEFALVGASVSALYGASKALIGSNLSPWVMYKKMNIEPNLEINHIDLKEVAPDPFGSLKIYATRMGSKKLQEYAGSFDDKLSKQGIKEVRKYNINDLVVTEELYKSILPQLDLRKKLSAKYDIDLMSKSDAQIAEAVLVKLTKYGGKAPKLQSDYTIKYVAPEYIKFKSKQLKDLKKLVESLEFGLDKGGSPQLPPELKGKVITIGSTEYTYALGGLHSKEKRLWLDEDMENGDIASMYPSLIINQGLYPKHLGKTFLNIYKSIRDERIVAKLLAKTSKSKAERDLNQMIADSFKIFLNGSYGKYGSKYSKLYSPNLLLQTTLTGQFVLLMLIEELEANGISVKSGNTDGVEVCVPTKKLSKLFKKITNKQGKHCNLVWEFGQYKGLYARDVNNYIANYGEHVKSKGVYGDTGLKKNRKVPICYKAVKEFIQFKTPLKTTILGCKDINEFVVGQTVNGGAMLGGEAVLGAKKAVVGTTGKTTMRKNVIGFTKDSTYAGKVVRFYFAKGGKTMLYRVSGNKVPLTDGGVKSLLDLPEKIPTDINYEWYYKFAEEALKDLGYDS